MPNTLKRLAGAQLAAGTAIIYTVPALTSTTFSVMVIANDGGGDRRVEVYAVPSGGAPDSSNILLNDVKVMKNESFEFGRGLILEAGGTIRANVSAGTGTTLTLYGIEST